MENCKESVSSVIDIMSFFYLWLFLVVLFALSSTTEGIDLCMHTVYSFLEGKEG